MALPFAPPLEPMLAKLANAIPDGDAWIFEPKWDGFRCLVFKDGDDVYLQSRDKKPLARYFPELIEPLRAQLPSACVLDGEVVIAKDGVLHFEALLQRIHPAKSRVDKLAAEWPASFVGWDLLALGDTDHRSTPFDQRRAMLVEQLADVVHPVYLTPATTDRNTAADWFTRFEGAGLDGIIAKPPGGAYLPNKRAMIKVKHARTADCVVAGFRWHKEGKGTMVGSLLLGLYDAEGILHHVGIASSFSVKRRKELAEFLEPLREGAADNHPWKEWANWAQSSHQRVPGGASRWNQKKDLSWEPLRIELCAEVAYDHLQGTRFRHATQLKHFRQDKTPSDCRYDQLETTAPAELAQLFGQAPQA